MGPPRNAGREAFSALPETDRRDRIGNLVGLPGLTVVFRE